MWRALSEGSWRLFGRPLEALAGFWRPLQGPGGPWRPLDCGGPGQNTSRYLASRRCYSTPGCRKAGERPGSTCAIDVDGHKRRPPSKVGGLCHEFRENGNCKTKSKGTKGGMKEGGVKELSRNRVESTIGGIL